MAVKPVISHGQGRYALYTWTLTAADQTASPTPLIGMRSGKTVEVDGAAGATGFNGATVEIQGTLSESPLATFKTLMATDGTTGLIFTAATTTLWEILPNAILVKPVITAGTLGSAGIVVRLLVVSPAVYARLTV